MTDMAHANEILTLLRGVEQRLAAVEARLAGIGEAAAGREAALRDALARKQRELEALGAQGLHIVEQLDAARRRIRELEAKG